MVKARFKDGWVEDNGGMRDQRKCATKGKIGTCAQEVVEELKRG